MCPLGNPDANGVYDEDPDEPPFTEDELDRATDLRARVTPHSELKRRDHCPHAVYCESVDKCIERIAWYLRYQREIEGL